MCLRAEEGRHDVEHRANCQNTVTRFLRRWVEVVQLTRTELRKNCSVTGKTLAVLSMLKRNPKCHIYA